VSMVYISTLTHKIVLKQQGAIPVSLNSAWTAFCSRQGTG
jgi:hypothetical protein